ncbi:hypothetical protein FACS1894105_01710 [Clostridia bacterium]|nr:hypothetical protein FACS1894105_01710 [Clostridia bacterium]
MDKIQIVDDVMFMCPLVNREMSESECYDVQMVCRRLIKATVLNFELDRVNAKQLCPNCPNCQLAWTNSKSVTASSQVVRM